MHASIDQTEEKVSTGVNARHELLGEVKRWGYQLQGLNLAEAIASPIDLLVIDEDFENRNKTIRRSDTIRSLTALKRKPNGSRRLVLAYLSIGEAEDYRRYWDRKWVTPALISRVQADALSPPDRVALTTPTQAASPSAKSVPRTTFEPNSSAPAWLGSENIDWRGNYHVRFWDERWQALILGNETAALDRIIAAGFDGIYLDRADAFLHWRQERPGARQDMASLVERISDRARALSPGFIIIMQNAEEMLGQHKIRAALDAVAKEDLLYGIDGTMKPNSDGEIATSVRLLKKAQNSGLPVLVVEYLSKPDLVAQARARIESFGFIPNFAPRALDQLVPGN